MWAVNVELAPAFRASKPELLFVHSFAADTTRQQSYDVAPDGERFLMVEDIENLRYDEVVVVVNWAEALKRRLPTD